MTRSCWAWDGGGSEGQEPLSEDGAGGGTGEGQLQECDRISAVSWTKASFFSAGKDSVSRMRLTGALLALTKPFWPPLFPFCLLYSQEVRARSSKPAFPL